LTPTILVVDDSSFITEGLGSLLRKNYRTIISSGGEMCLEILKKEIPDIILLDILMEPMDGWETLLHIRENPATRHIPVIMFSAKKISPFEAETHHPYIDDYITKPVSPRNLLDAIAKVLSRKEAGQRTLELWKHAGLPTEEIEEYARLMTSIEVDRGLCANMQQQLDSERKDTPLDEIRKTIGVISSRIRENTSRAEEIARKGDFLVAAGTEPDAIPSVSAKMPCDEPQQGEGEPLSGTMVSGPDPAEQILPPEDLQAASGTPELEILEIAVNPAGGIEVLAPDPAEKTQDCAGQRIGDSGRATPPTENPVHFPAEQESTQDMNLSPIPDGEIRTTPRSEEMTTPDNLPVSTLSESLFEEEQDSPSTVIESTPVQFPVITQRERDGQVISTEPAKDDTEQSHQVQETTASTPQPRREPPPQAGGEAEVNSRQTAPSLEFTGSSRAMKTPETPKSRDNRQSAPPDKEVPSPGIFARIITAITSLFSRSKR
jgi:two-component system, OmpR family, response regulator